jgi:hypothetical protein
VTGPDDRIDGDHSKGAAHCVSALDSNSNYIHTCTYAISAMLVDPASQSHPRADTSLPLQSAANSVKRRLKKSKPAYRLLAFLAGY